MKNKVQITSSDCKQLSQDIKDCNARYKTRY